MQDQQKQHLLETGPDEDRALCSGPVSCLASLVDGLSAEFPDMNCKERLNSHLASYLCLLKHMSKLHRAKNDLGTVADDVVEEKNNLKNQLSELWCSLKELRIAFLELGKDNRDTFITLSTIQLSLADYQRKKELYALFNHIDDLVRRTLSETERIGKLAFYSRQFDSLNRCKASSIGFDGVLDQLLSHMAQFHQTREYIDAQLSLARSSNIDSALTSGTHRVDKACTDGALHNFLEFGCLPDVSDLELFNNPEPHQMRPESRVIEVEEVSESVL